MATPTSPNEYPRGYFEQNIGATLVAVSAVSIALDIIFVGLRFILGASTKHPGARMTPLYARRLYSISELAQ